MTTLGACKFFQGDEICGEPVHVVGHVERNRLIGRYKANVRPLPRLKRVDQGLVGLNVKDTSKNFARFRRDR